VVACATVAVVAAADEFSAAVLSTASDCFLQELLLHSCLLLQYELLLLHNF
jgi:hypothetical protein